MADSEIRRGDVVWLDFSRQGGAPIEKRRPALVIQNNAGNRFAPHTIVAAVRGDTKKGLPVQVEVPKGVAGLTKDSVVDCGFISTVPKNKLGNTIGTLPLDHMKDVDRALRVSLSLG